jgi:DNA-binding response OmpR family regulator
MRVLLVEDEPLIALDLADQLQAAGHEVIGPAASIEHALDLIQTERLDAAVLNVDLGGERPAVVAEALRIKSTPFVVVSGHPRPSQSSLFSGVVWLEKPHKEEHLLAALALTSASADNSDRPQERRSDSVVKPSSTGKRADL